jgi:hypothetical protein
MFQKRKRSKEQRETARRANVNHRMKHSCRLELRKEERKEGKENYPATDSSTIFLFRVFLGLSQAKMNNNQQLQQQQQQQQFQAQSARQFQTQSTAYQDEEKVF